MRWPLMLRSTHALICDGQAARNRAAQDRENALGRDLQEAKAEAAAMERLWVACDKENDALRAALAEERKAHRRTMSALLRLKADGTLAPKRGTAPAAQPASDPVSVAIEDVCAAYPAPQRGALARQQRAHAARLKAQGMNDAQIADALREGARAD